MKFNVSSLGSTVLVALDGDLNSLESPRFESSIMDVLSRNRGEVAFDLKGLRYLNSSGIRAFVRIKRHLDQNDRHMILYGATDSVQGVFEMTRLDMLFDIRETL